MTNFRRGIVWMVRIDEAADSAIFLPVFPQNVCLKQTNELDEWVSLHRHREPEYLYPHVIPQDELAKHGQTLLRRSALILTTLAFKLYGIVWMVRIKGVD